MQYVILRKGKFVAQPGSQYSFTTDVLRARKFDTKEAALRECCDNESVRELADVLRQYGIK